MPLKVLYEGLKYSVVGRLNVAELGQVFEESPWDNVTTRTFLARGYIEEVATLETSEPVVEVVEEETELDLASMSKSELVELASARGLPTNGTKKTLLARLTSEEEEE